MRRLAEAGLTTREACGNSVRNITACPFAGVSADEVFDVTPYAEALTRYLLRHPLSSSLAAQVQDRLRRVRRGSHEDRHQRPRIPGDRFGRRRARIPRHGRRRHVHPLPHRLAPARLRADRRDLRRRRRRAAGLCGVRRLPAQAAQPAEVPDQEHGLGAMARGVPPRARRRPRRAAPRTAVQPGSRGDRSTARRAGAVRRRTFARSRPAPPRPQLRGAGLRPSLLPVTNDSEERWLRTNVRPQKQRGYSVAIVTIPLGDLTAPQFRILADLAAVFGDGTVRVTVEQNLIFRWVRTDRAARLLRGDRCGPSRVFGARDHRGRRQLPRRRVVPPRRDAVARPRPAARRSPARAVRTSRPRPDAGDIKISGCPNGCGQHHVAAIGFQGSIRSLGARAVPQYFVMAGGGADGDGRGVRPRSSRRFPRAAAPEAVDRLVGALPGGAARRRDAGRFMRRADLARLKSALADLEPLTEADAPRRTTSISEKTTAFAPEVLDGECSA